ncbi:zinc-binding dehydrogenase [Corynebacterium phocae]|uniref:zinc-binding dehydrogenase n=1 Tax=Corynebacterium phocae TaxID=161895 RepID=UPI001239C455|nr:zinc-binding dehydrogenase [Corynebacterium phocae]KAA8725379.1 zinc-binding dehydrogenase [Corynebacterium phocae]
MLLAALGFALVAFVSLVFYVLTAHQAALVVLFAAVGIGLIFLAADVWRKWTNGRK